jgi:hypothetical protein
MDLAPQVAAGNIEFIFMAGDGCLLGPNPAACDPRELNPALLETSIRRNNDQASARLAELGVPHTYIQREGVHGDGRQETYRDFFLPRLNKLFSESVADPVRFTYKTVDTAFSIWGFDFSVDRGNNEFLNILGARRDARDLMLAGTGIVHVRTPPVFHPGRSYRVLVTPAGQPSQESVVVPVGEGRIELDVTLGPPRDVDERRELVENGQFPFPVTRIEVLDRARTALALDAPAAGQITDPVQVRATLTSHGVPLSGKPVSFELGSQHVAATTGSDGVAAATLVLTAPAGPTELSAAFSGDEAYDESRQVAAFEVTKETTLLTYEGEPRAKGETVHAAARLVEDDGPGLVGVPVTFEIKGSRTTVLTDGTGRATADLTVGDHGRSQVLTITYPGDASYSSAQQSVTVAWGKGLL